MADLRSFNVNDSAIVLETLIYDCSDKGSVTFTDLSEAIASVPASFQRGGLTIKFVLTSDTSNYLSYTLNNTTWTTNTSYWSSIVQELGTSTNNIMSQNAVTEMMTYDKDDWSLSGKYIVDISVGDELTLRRHNNFSTFKVHMNVGNKAILNDIIVNSLTNYLYFVDDASIVVEVIDKSATEYTATQNGYLMGSSTKGYVIVDKIISHVYDIQNDIADINDVLFSSKTYDVSYNNTAYYDRRGNLIPWIHDDTWHASSKIKISELDYPSYITINGFNGGNITLLSNVVLWDKNENCITYNINDGVYEISLIGYDTIAFCNNSYAGRVSLKYQTPVQLENKLNDISVVNFEYDSTYKGLFINNFIDSSIDSDWFPTYISSEAWNTYNIDVLENDIVVIDSMYSMHPLFSSKVLFIDSSNIVVSPTEELVADTMYYNKTYIVETDGKMYFTTKAASDNGIIIKRPVTTAINKLKEDITAIKETEDTSSEYIVATAYVDCPVGRNTDIFLDGIINVPDDVKRKPYYVRGTSELYQYGSNCIHWNPSDTSVGNQSLRIVKYNDLEYSSVNSESTVIFRPVSVNSGDGSVINICISGDSLVDGTAAACEAYRLLAEDGDYDIHQIGTRTATYDGVTYKHEGRGSWRWSTYINPDYETTTYSNKTNAFMVDGELNFQKYMENNFPNEVAADRGIDIFIMALGTNDVTQGYSIPSDSTVANIISYAKTFIDALLSEDKGYPDCKVIVGLPGVGSINFSTSNSFAGIFKSAILKLNKAYIEAFDNGTYHANVTCVMHGCYIDRENGYQYADVGRNDYINDDSLTTLLTTMNNDASVNSSVKQAITYIAQNYVSHNKQRICSNQVHPLQIGYRQWGRGYYGKIRAILDGLL